MTSQTALPPLTPPSTGTGEPPFSPVLIEELMKLLVKAMRAHQLYMPNNPVYQRAIENVRRGFPPVWAHTDEILLTPTELEFKWEGRVVMHEENKQESVPWLFFKDGIRELRLLRGVEGDELVSLLEILKRVKNTSPEEDDLLTLLWEKDFAYLRYRFIDLATESAAPIEAKAEARQIEPVPPQEIEQAPEARPGIVRLEDLDATVHFLDEHELDYLRAAVRSEYESDVRRNVLSILLDLFELQTARPVREEIGEILDNFMLYLLSANEFRTVAYILRETTAVVERARELDAAHRTRFLGFPDRLSAAETLSRLLQSMDESDSVPAQEELNELFEQLRPASLATVFTWLGRLQNVKLREALEVAAARLAAANTAELVRLITATDAAVSLEATRRAGSLKTAAAVAPLGKLLTHEAPASRLAGAQALAEIGTAGALQQLERAVADSDRDVRVTAVRVLGLRGHRAALAKVETAVKSKALREADLTEKMAFFEAYSALAGAGGVVALDVMLHGKGFLGKKEEPEIRACAAMALGKIRTGEAIAALQRAQSEKEALVRNAVTRALREAGV